MSLSTTSLRNELHALASPEIASLQQRYFKTGPGQYGEGDVFLGIKVPPLRALAKRHREVELHVVSDLLVSTYHEERLLALLLLMQLYQRGNDEQQCAAFELYLNHTQHINNWDLVDVSAPHIVGPHLEIRPREILHSLARSASLWERRIAILATFHFIRLNDFDDALRIAEILLADKHDLMHKAVGWMLREIGKRDLAAEENFLQNTTATCHAPCCATPSNASRSHGVCSICVARPDLKQTHNLPA
jgi:3-methyladenine DNA glycosylase AlkD